MKLKAGEEAQGDVHKATRLEKVKAFFFSSGFSGCQEVFISWLNLRKNSEKALKASAIFEHRIFTIFYINLKASCINRDSFLYADGIYTKKSLRIFLITLL